MKPSIHPHAFFLRVRLILLVLLLFSVACGQSASSQFEPTTPAQSASSVPFQSPTAIPTVLPSLTSTAAPTDISQPTAIIAPTAIDTSEPTSVAQASQVTVDFIDVGQGDAILIRSAEGQVALIDGGEQGSGVLAYLTNQGIDHIDMVVATHPHSDHIGGLIDVLETIPVGQVVTNSQPHTTQIYERFLDGIINSEAEYIEAVRGDVLPFGNLSIQVLGPAGISGDDLNDNSLVLRLVVGQVTFLFTGDAQAAAESSMVGSDLPLSAAILKVGHHGSHTSSSEAFLAQVQPMVAVYMAGAANQYGHPHAETITALTTAGAETYGTDTNGTISITTDGSTYQVSAGTSGPGAPPVVQAIESSAEVGPPSLEILSVTSPIRRGERATLQARSAPGANCAITVYYKSGPSKASGLEPKAADSSGNISWSWNVGSKTTPGTWRIVVECSQAGETLLKEITFEVIQ